MVKSKVLFIALGGSVIGILGYFLPWITISIFVEQSISGFSLIRLLFGTGRGNLFQQIGYQAAFIVPAILLVLALVALLFTGVHSALMLRSNNVTKTSGILLTIVSGIAFLIVVGIALSVSISIREQTGSYVDISSYLRYGIGFFIASLGALAVTVSGILVFQEGTRRESGTADHFAQDQIHPHYASGALGVKNQKSAADNSVSPVPGVGAAQPAQVYPQGQPAAWNQVNLHANQAQPRQQYSGPPGQVWQAPQSKGGPTPPAAPMPQQPPYNQAPAQPGQVVPNQGWNLPPRSAPPPPGQFRSPAAGQPLQPWQANQNMGWNQQPVQPPHGAPFTPPQPRSGNQQPGSNSFPKQPSQFSQRKSQIQPPLNQANNQPPLDKPWERVQYRGPNRAPLTPQVPPVLPSQDTGQGREWIPPYKPPHYGQEDPHTRPDYMTPLEDPEMTRYDRVLDKQNTSNDNI